MESVGCPKEGEKKECEAIKRREKESNSHRRIETAGDTGPTSIAARFHDHRGPTAPISGRVPGPAEVRRHGARRGRPRHEPVDQHLEQPVLPHGPPPAQVRRVDDALDRNVERPLEDGGEGRTLPDVGARDVDFDGAAAEVPRVRDREAGAGVAAEGEGREGLLAHGDVVDGLFAFYVGDWVQLGLARWVLGPTSDRDGEGRVADERGRRDGVGHGRDDGRTMRIEEWVSQRMQTEKFECMMMLKLSSASASYISAWQRRGYT